LHGASGAEAVRWRKRSESSGEGWSNFLTFRPLRRPWLRLGAPQRPSVQLTTLAMPVMGTPRVAELSQQETREFAHVARSKSSGKCCRKKAWVTARRTAPSAACPPHSWVETVENWITQPEVPAYGVLILYPTGMSASVFSARAGDTGVGGWRRSRGRRSSGRSAQCDGDSVQCQIRGKVRKWRYIIQIKARSEYVWIATVCI
jgi:hypothetical protein